MLSLFWNEWEGTGGDIVLIPRARADERGEHVELQNGFLRYDEG